MHLNVRILMVNDYKQGQILTTLHFPHQIQNQKNFSV